MGSSGQRRRAGAGVTASGDRSPSWPLLSSSRVTVIRGKTGFSSVSESTARWALTSP